MENAEATELLGGGKGDLGRETDMCKGPVAGGQMGREKGSEAGAQAVRQRKR